MSATPIFEQLCRDYADAGKPRPADVAKPLFASQPTVPALPAGIAGGGPVYQRGGHPSSALPQWVRPGD